MREVVYTPNAPEPIGPFSQAIKAQGIFLYVSGTIGMNNGKLVEGGIKEETLQIMENIREVLVEAGYYFKDVVKANVYLTDMNDFAAMNEVYAMFISKPEPARTTVQVSRLPKDAVVEIELIAVK